jgi:hypothetical protein
MSNQITVTSTVAQAKLQAQIDAFSEGVGNPKLELRNDTTVLVVFELNDPAFNSATDACPSVSTGAGSFPISVNAEDFGGSPLEVDNARLLNGDDEVKATMTAAQIGTGAQFAVNISNTTIEPEQPVNLNSIQFSQPC